MSCFRSVARHLVDGGLFVVEAFVPDLGRFDGGQRVQANWVGLDEVFVEASRHDPASQRVDSQNIRFRDGRVELYPVSLRYAWPSELDLMAQLAGMRVRGRWAGWNREPFTEESKMHVSVYELTPG